MSLRFVYRLNSQAYQLEGSMNAHFTSELQPMKFSWVGVGAKSCWPTEQGTRGDA